MCVCVCVCVCVHVCVSSIAIDYDKKHLQLPWYLMIKHTMPPHQTVHYVTRYSLHYKCKHWPHNEVPTPPLGNYSSAEQDYKKG